MSTLQRKISDARWMNPARVVVDRSRKSDLTVAYTYTLADRLASVTYPGATPQTVSYGRDTVGRVNSISVNGISFISAVSYYPWGPVRTITYANGGNPQTLTKTYDANYAIDAISSTRVNGLNIDYTVDITGNIKQLQQAASTRVLEYDLLDRLRQVTSGSQPIETYSYDAVGNRLSARAGNGATVPYAYFPGTHRLQTVGNGGKAGGGGSNRRYDEAGNSTYIPPSFWPNLGYDERNRLVGASGASMQSVGYDYNARGERVLREMYGGGFATSITMYTESGAPAVFEDFNPGHTFRSVIYLDQLPVGLIDNGALMQIETDHLGTPRAVSNGSTVVWRWELVSGTTSDGGSNAFGDQQPNEDVDGNGTPYRFDLRFPGQIYDAQTKLHYNYFRDYEPGTGRYVESDPIGLRGGVSTYGYSSGQPLLRADPLGLLSGDGLIDECYGQPLWACENNRTPPPRAYECLAAEYYSAARSPEEAFNLAKAGKMQPPSGRYSAEDLRDAEHYVFAHNLVSENRRNAIWLIPATPAYSTAKGLGLYPNTSEPSLDEVDAGLAAVTDAMFNKKPRTCVCE